MHLRSAARSEAVRPAAGGGRMPRSRKPQRRRAGLRGYRVGPRPRRRRATPGPRRAPAPAPGPPPTATTARRRPPPGRIRGLQLIRAPATAGGARYAHSGGRSRRAGPPTTDPAPGRHLEHRGRPPGGAPPTPRRPQPRPGSATNQDAQQHPPPAGGPSTPSTATRTLLPRPRPRPPAVTDYPLDPGAPARRGLTFWRESADRSRQLPRRFSQRPDASTRTPAAMAGGDGRPPGSTDPGSHDGCRPGSLATIQSRSLCQCAMNSAARAASCTKFMVLACDGAERL